MSEIQLTIYSITLMISYVSAAINRARTTLTLDIQYAKNVLYCYNMATLRVQGVERSGASLWVVQNELQFEGFL